MKFRYQARTKEGELQVGFIEAPTKETAVNILASHNLYILSIVESAKQKGIFFSFLNRVTSKDLMVFTRQFATLLESNVPLSDTLKTLANQTRNLILKEAIIDIGDDVDSGLSLSQAFEKRNDIFSIFYVNMIRSAEVTGRVDEVMNYLADYVEKQAILTSKIRNAMIYPAIMIFLFLVVGTIMGSVVLPQLGVIFKEFDTEIPLMTQILINSGTFLASWWWAIGLVFIVLGVFIGDYIKTEEGRTMIDDLTLKIPLFSQLLKQLYVARFSESLAILIKGGIPIVQAIEVTGKTIGSAVYAEILQSVARDVQKGELISRSLAKHEEFFPALVGQLIAVGEATGRLEVLLKKISVFYTREVEDLVVRLTELIQPILLIFIGGLIGLLFMSILGPIFQMIGSI